MAKSKAVELLKKSMTRKGKIKGRNKKETKRLKSMCTHFKMNKKGKLVSAAYPIHGNGDESQMYCPLCGQIIKGNFYSKKDRKKIVKDFRDMNSQNIYLSVAVGANGETTDYFAEIASNTTGYNKKAEKINKIAKKQDAIKSSRKRKNKKNTVSSNSYGTW